MAKSNQYKGEGEKFYLLISQPRGRSIQQSSILSKLIDHSPNAVRELIRDGGVSVYDVGQRLVLEVEIKKIITPELSIKIDGE